MPTVIVTLPRNIPGPIVDEIGVSVLVEAIDRQPRHTYLEGIDRTDPEVVTLTFKT